MNNLYQRKPTTLFSSTSASWSLFIFTLITSVLFISNNFQCISAATSFHSSKSSTTFTGHNYCTFNLKDVPSKEPLYLYNVSQLFKFYTPENQTNILSNNYHIIFNCAGKRNTIQIYGKSLNKPDMRMVCRNGNLVDDNMERIPIQNITCDKTPAADIKINNENCADGRGLIYRIGFELESNEFITLFTICYDKDSENTFYSKHIINGKAIQYSVKESRRTTFKATGMTANKSKQIQQFYQKNNQIEIFQNLFGPNQKYIDNTNFLARGHLTPDADFIFPSAQLATYFYVNVAPEFQIINAGNWKRVENLARQLATGYNTNFEIYTGTHGKLKLKDLRNDEEKSIYLDDSRKIEVPKWFWKVIQNLKTKDAIAMITLNNPYTNNGQLEEFCPNVCQQARINTKNLYNVAKGYTYCCEVKAFRNIVKDLPKNFTVNNLLDCSIVKMD